MYFFGAMPAKHFEPALVDGAPPVTDLFTSTMTHRALPVLPGRRRAV
jgi:hypothetical protein